MKSLFEIITDRFGESYVRSYAWAECEEDAREIFKAVADHRGHSHSVTEVRRLFTAADSEFVTLPSDSGFETEGMVQIRDLRKLYSVKMPMNDN